MGCDRKMAELREFYADALKDFLTGKEKQCRLCQHADRNRTNNQGHIRCTRFSMFVVPEHTCKEFTSILKVGN